jgi:hypothetical protein
MHPVNESKLVAAKEAQASAAQRLAAAKEKEVNLLEKWQHKILTLLNLIREQNEALKILIKRGNNMPQVSRPGMTDKDLPENDAVNAIAYWLRDTYEWPYTHERYCAIKKAKHGSNY